jgi:hypothetical protein
MISLARAVTFEGAWGSGLTVPPAFAAAFYRAAGESSVGACGEQRDTGQDGEVEDIERIDREAERGAFDERSE